MRLPAILRPLFGLGSVNTYRAAATGADFFERKE
jgi:hypothetical protein